MAVRTYIRWACFIGGLFTTISVNSQQAIFSGGAGDGHATASYEQSQPLGYELYMGGNEDGYGASSYLQNAVPDNQLFMGGIGDGYATNGYLQANPLGVAIYAGGIGDGADESSYEQDLTITFGVYTGGIGDGYAEASYAQAQILGAELFAGGRGDGHNMSSYQQGAVTGFALYAGGLGDGYATDSYLQPSTASQVLFYGGLGDGYDGNGFGQGTAPGSEIYAGGAGDGADQDDFEQGVIAVFGVYTGGDGDGFDLAEYQQSDFVDALPVELLTFQAALDGQQVAITWSTTAEVNNHYFLVQRSNDLKQWAAIDSVAGAGNSNQLTTYRSTDRNPRTMLNYYRLKQVDYDGTTSYSMIRTVDLIGVMAAAEMIVYPNPVRDRINIQFSGFVSQEVALKIYDAQGRLVYEKKLSLPAGQGVYEINRAAHMLQGYYVVIATDEVNDQLMKTRMFIK